MEDSEFILELVNTPKWLKNIGDRKVYNLSDAEKYIMEKSVPQIERLGYGNYVMIRQSDQVKVGTCGLYDREGLDGVDIGFALLPAYERQGYAYEAAKELLQEGFGEFGLTKVSGITTTDNMASQKLLEKLGLIAVGPVVIPGDDEELILYELTKEV